MECGRDADVVRQLRPMVEEKETNPPTTEECAKRLQEYVRLALAVTYHYPPPYRDKNKVACEYLVSVLEHIYNNPNQCWWHLHDRLCRPSEPYHCISNKLQPCKSCGANRIMSFFHAEMGMKLTTFETGTPEFDWTYTNLCMHFWSNVLRTWGLLSD
jgi:hypothetical protein